MTEPIPTLVGLPEPRELTASERALVNGLVAFADVPNLSEQLGSVRVVSVCACGCGSVGLRTAGPPVPAADVARLSDQGRDDYFGVSASAGDVSVVLHVVHGLVEELEIFAGEGVPVGTPDASRMIKFRSG